MQSICVCEGRYQGCDHGKTCNKQAGGRWSPHFCIDCDENRTLHIDRVFDSLMEKSKKDRR